MDHLCRARRRDPARRRDVGKNSSGDASPALDVLNSTALRGAVYRHATPEATVAADLAVPRAGAAGSMSRGLVVAIGVQETSLQFHLNMTSL